MSLFDRLFRRAADPKDALRPLYASVVAAAREPHWYLDGGVDDTLDGRFDMVALVISQLLLRIEDSPAHAQSAVLLTEVFVEDMDSQMRQIGFGDMVVGKQIGRIMSALGGRLGAYRAAGDDRTALEAALVRNLWRGETPPASALAHVTDQALALRARLKAADVAALLAQGRLPA